MLLRRLATPRMVCAVAAAAWLPLVVAWIISSLSGRPWYYGQCFQLGVHRWCHDGTGWEYDRLPPGLHQ